MSGTPNTSNELGFLTQTSGPLEDPLLTDALTATVVGVTGLPASLVRPRWQPIPPNQPSATTDWCAIGITERVPTDYPYILHDPTGNGGVGRDILSDWESLTIIASFYGPDSFAYAGVLRRGLNVSQNRDALYAASIKVTEIGSVTAVPDLVNLQFIDHVDLRMTLCRVNVSTYNVDSFVGAVVQITTDPGEFTETGAITADSDPQSC